MLKSRNISLCWDRALSKYGRNCRVYTRAAKSVNTNKQLQSCRTCPNQHIQTMNRLCLFKHPWSKAFEARLWIFIQLRSLFAPTFPPPNAYPYQCLSNARTTQTRNRVSCKRSLSFAHPCSRCTKSLDCTILSAAFTVVRSALWLCCCIWDRTSTT